MFILSLMLTAALRGPQDPAQELKIQTPAAPERIAFSPDGRILATLVYSQCLLIAWNPTTGEKLYEFRGSGGNKYGLFFSSDGKKIVLPGSGGHPTVVLEAETGKVAAEFKSVNAYRYAVSRDASILACSDADSPGTVLYDLAKGAEIARLKDEGGVPAFSADGRALLSLHSDATLSVWDLETKKESARLGDPVHAGPADLLRASALNASPDGKRWIAVCEAERYSQPGDNRGEKGAAEIFIDVWDAAARKKVRRITGKDSCMARMGHDYFCVISPDASLACLKDRDGARSIDLGSGKPASKFEPCLPLDFSQDGKEWLAAQPPGKLVLWDVTTGKATWRQEGRGPAALSFDGRRAAFYAKDAVHLILLKSDR